MALEDSWALYQELSSDVPESLIRFSKRREPRLRQAKTLVKQQLRWKISRSHTITKLRDAVAKYVPLHYFMKGYYQLVRESP